MEIKKFATGNFKQDKSILSGSARKLGRTKGIYDPGKSLTDVDHFQFDQILGQELRGVAPTIAYFCKFVATRVHGRCVGRLGKEQNSRSIDGAVQCNHQQSVVLV
jgi:hypothetical protein